jgi:hypothetical protein
MKITTLKQAKWLTRKEMKAIKGGDEFLLPADADGGYCNSGSSCGLYIGLYGITVQGSCVWMDGHCRCRNGGWYSGPSTQDSNSVCWVKTRI